jgi:hypothetical protein
MPVRFSACASARFDYVDQSGAIEHAQELNGALVPCLMAKSRVSIYGAIAANVAIAVTKLAAPRQIRRGRQAALGPTAGHDSSQWLF